MPTEGWGLSRVFDHAKDWIPHRNDDEVEAPDSNDGHALVHPRYLHTNASGHTWVFGALAEVLDNSVDAGATKVEVDIGEVSIFRDGRRYPERSIEVTDDGGGMHPKTLQRCLGYGHSVGRGPESIGGFGNGLKTGAMRLGAVTLVITRTSDSSTVGLYSYLYNARECGDTVRIPQVSWDSEMNPVGSERDFNAALNLILKWGPYGHLQDLWDKLLQLPKTGGTKIVISYLWNETNEEDKLELDFDSDSRDIWIPDGVKGIEHMRSLQEGESLLRDNSIGALKEIKNRMSSREAGKMRFDMGSLRAMAHKFSLREYIKMLYLPSRFNQVSWDGIYLRGWKVDLDPIASNMQHCESFQYRPQRERNGEGNFQGVDAADSATVDLGFMRESPETAHQGICIYRRGRLVLAYLDVFRTNWSTGRGVIGVVEQEHIVWNHTKQQLAQGPPFTKLVATLKDKIKKYWGNNAYKVGYKAERHDSAKEKKRKGAEGGGGGGDAGPDTPDTPGGRKRSRKKEKKRKEKEPVEPKEEEVEEEEDWELVSTLDEMQLEDMQREVNGLRPRKRAQVKAESSSQATRRAERRQRIDALLDSDSDVEDVPLAARAIRKRTDKAAVDPEASRKAAALQEQLKQAEDRIRELESESEHAKRREAALLCGQGAMKQSLDKVKQSLRTLRHGVAGYCCDDAVSRRELLDLYKTCTEDGIVVIPKIEPHRHESHRSRTPTPPLQGERGHEPVWQDRRDRKPDVRDHPALDGRRDRGRGRHDRPQYDRVKPSGPPPPPPRYSRDDDWGYSSRDDGYDRRRTPSPERGWPQQHHPGHSRPHHQQKPRAQGWSWNR